MNMAFSKCLCDQYNHWLRFVSPHKIWGKNYITTKQTKKQNCVKGHLAHTGICFVIFSSTLILLDTDKLHSKTDPTFKTKMYCHSHLLRELTPPRVVHQQVSTISAHHFTNLQNMIPNRCTTKVHMKICVWIFYTHQAVLLNKWLLMWAEKQASCYCCKWNQFCSFAQL